MKAQWLRERDTIRNIQNTKEKIDEAHIEEQKAERAGNLSRVAEIRYGLKVQLDKDLETAKQQLQDIQAQHMMLKEEVDAEDIAAIVAKWTGIPVAKLLEGEKDKLVHAEKILAKKVVGQKQAIQAVANAVRRARAGLQNPDRPLGSFIFLGPTGVGKTELARALADFLFDDEQAMIRIDMSEFMEKHSVARLIGAPPGYVGYEEGGYLTESVRRRPYSVILLDEIEKAHPEVFNILLQLLDDGRMTDGKGRTVDFKNALVIMTSNLGSQLIMKMAADGVDKASVQQQIDELLHSQFKPEFLNRVDDIIIFDSLRREDLLSIVDIQLKKLINRLEQKNISLHVRESAKHFLVDSGYNTAFGARPLKRAIQRHLEDALAMKLLEGEFTDRDHIIVEATSSGLHFSRQSTS